MKQLPKVSRRSFLATVAGGAMGATMLSDTASAATTQGCTDRDPAPPSGDPGGRGRNCTSTPTPTPTGCSDSDSGAGADPGGRGRNCRSTPQTGCSDTDSGSGSDPGGRGRTCQSRPQTGCSDSDSGSGADPGGRGRNCGTRRNDDTYVTGRRERTYEVCWVDHPSRSNDECNIQTYTEWAITYSDGRVEYDTAEADARKAEMTRRGYTARSHRILQNW